MDALLVIHSGQLAIAVDAAGFSSGSGTKSLFPKLGTTAGLPATATARQVYDALPALDTSLIKLESVCTDPSISKTYVLGSESPGPHALGGGGGGSSPPAPHARTHARTHADPLKTEVTTARRAHPLCPPPSRPLARSRSPARLQRARTGSRRWDWCGRGSP